jgi:DNA polymerase elongation subunit (family B)
LNKEEELTKLKKENADEKKLKEIESERDLNDNRQKVYKILANALYGVLGNHVFRFFNTDCARSVTLSGQEMIKASILEADKYVDFIKTKKHERPDPVTKEDMYVEEMDRETKNIITGDTDSLFITYENVKENVTIKDMDEWNKRIQDFLNEELVPELVKRHRVDIKNSRLELKNELLINRGLFLAKKRYALHVIRREGKMIDDVQVKGLETRRSDYPSYSKECIKELLDLILKSEKVSLKKMMEFVKGKESDFLERIKHGDKSVARPCSWTKKLSEYKVLSQGVKAMQNWNDLVYPIHAVGAKGYLFKLQGIDLDKAPKDVVDRYNKEFLGKGRKLEVIAIPDEEERLPEYFIPDVKEMLEFSWKDRCGLILDPLTQVKESDKVLTF